MASSISHRLGCASSGRWPRPDRSRPPRSPSDTRSLGLAAGGDARGDRRPAAVRARPLAVALTPAGAACSDPRPSGSSTSSMSRCRELSGEEAALGRVRLGAFPTAAAGLVPGRLASLPPRPRGHAAEAPDARPWSARFARGTLDLAVIARSPPFRPARRRITGTRADHAVRARARRRRSRQATRSLMHAPSRFESSRARSGSRADRTQRSRCSACGRASRERPRSATSCAIGSRSSRSSRRPGHHNARPDDARRAPDGVADRRGPRRAPGDAAPCPGSPPRAARGRRRAGGRRAHRRRSHLNRAWGR